MPETKTNGLEGAASAYLSSAAHQPVDWHAWGPEVFARARDEQKPVLLDIGAVWCHWCHVMDRESYESEEIAALINRHFVAVKVDRDERPDIDARYQAAVSAITRQGGWPLTAFLTPDGNVFFGGTYFPPDDRWGRPGFKRILTSIAHNFKENRAEVDETAGKLTEALRDAEQFSGAKGVLDSHAVVNRIIEDAYRLYDDRNGGFGSAPKFPHPAVLDLLMEYGQSAETGGEVARNAAVGTLEHMARGGVYDQLAGGFHRYSVDAVWHVPHFEKMSYDNSELLRNYLHGFQLTGNDLFRETGTGIVTWVQRTLSDPGRGGFFSSQDADINLDDDGDHFTWTLAEARACLDAEELELVREHFNLREKGAMQHDPARNVLGLHQTAEELAEKRSEPVSDIRRTLSDAREKMLAARGERPVPFIDRTVYTGWNGLMISAFLEAAQVLERDDCRELAVKSLDRILDSAWSARWGFAHRVPEGETKTSEETAEWGGGILDDQVFMAHALLDAWEVSGEARYLNRAEETMRLCIDNFWDDSDNADDGFFDRPKAAPPIAEGVDLPRKPFQDSPTPGGNPLAAMALDRLHGYTLKDELREKAQRTLDTFAGAVSTYGIFVASFGLAALVHQRGPIKIVVVGSKDDSRTAELAAAARRDFRYGKRVLVFEPEDARADRLPAGLAMTLPHLGGEDPVALVCGDGSCQSPARTVGELAAALSAAMQAVAS